MRNLHYHVIFRPEPEGGFTALVPSLPGCITYGKDLREAKKMALGAIRAYIASLRKDKEPIPSDEDNFTSIVDTKITLAHA